VFLIALLAGGGWFFTTGPGKGKLGPILTAISKSQTAAPQVGMPGVSTGIAPLPEPAPIQATYGAPLGAAPAAAPAQPAPAPMFGGPAIRIASFNIQVFGDAKARDQDAMATIAAIVHNFHIVAIQEIRTQDDYFLDNFLRTWVNQNGRAYDKVVGPRLGRSNSKEQYAFLYDTATIQVNRHSIYTVNDPDDLLHREPLVAMFRTRGPPPEQAFTFVLVNIHTDPDETDSELNALAQVYQAVRRNSNGEDDIIILGDLNVDDQNLGELGRIDGVRPLIRGIYTNTRQNALYDNFVLHQPSTAEFSGRAGIFNYLPLYNQPPEQAMARALKVSDHLPIWAEFSAYEAATPGRVAGREVSGVR
jgi:endonuclease/exonuclease/phosphatase family metal-dependent hydrolase